MEKVRNWVPPNPITVETRRRFVDYCDGILLDLSHVCVDERGKLQSLGCDRYSSGVNNFLDENNVVFLLLHKLAFSRSCVIHAMSKFAQT